MPKHKLVLLTSQYPFGTGEEFLETEILYLAEHFYVEIIPTSPNIDFELKRLLPQNVDVRQDIYTKITHSFLNKKSWLLQHPKLTTKIVGIVRHEAHHLITSPKRLRRLIGFSINSLIILQCLDTFYKHIQIDVFYSYWLNHNAFALTFLKKRYPKTLFISRTHRGDLYSERSTIHYLPAQKQIIQGIDKVVCISKHGKDYLHIHYPELSNKFVLKRLGSRQPLVRNKFNNDNILYVVTCSYLVPVKRISLFIQALAQCFLPIHWTHLGGGALESEINGQSSKLPKNIQWHITGLLPNKTILRFYTENPVDLFVNVSSSEGLPVSIMEAMSYGIPIAATDVGGVNELVDNGKNGFLWPTNITPKAIADTLYQFYNMSVPQKLAMRDNAQHTWAEKVNAAKQYDDFTKWLVNLGKQTN